MLSTALLSMAGLSDPIGEGQDSRVFLSNLASPNVCKEYAQSDWRAKNRQQQGEVLNAYYEDTARLAGIFGTKNPLALTLPNGIIEIAIEPQGELEYCELRGCWIGSGQRYVEGASIAELSREDFTKSQAAQRVVSSFYRALERVCGQFEQGGMSILQVTKFPAPAYMNTKVLEPEYPRFPQLVVTDFADCIKSCYDSGIKPVRQIDSTIIPEFRTCLVRETLRALEIRLPQEGMRNR